MLSKLNDSPGAKAGLILVVAIIVAIAVYVGVRANSGDAPADPKQVQADAQKQVDIIKNQNLPPALKQEMLNHYQGLAKGQGSPSPRGAQTAPPTGN